MQTNWDVQAVHAYVNERVSILGTHAVVPVRQVYGRGAFFQKLRTRFISLFWL